MTILTRYFTRQLVMFFIMLVVVLVGLAWMMQILTLLRLLIQYGISVFMFLGLTSLMLPIIISIILPFAVFIATMFIYNKLISDREITVMAASSMSPLQIARPALIIAGLITVLNFALSLYIVPNTQGRFMDTQWNLRHGLAHLVIQESTFTQLSRGLVVFVEQVSGHHLSGLMLYDGRNPEQQITVSADLGKLVHTDRGLSLVMTHGSVQWRGEQFIVGTFDAFDMDMNLIDGSGHARMHVRRTPTAQLVHNAHNLDRFNARDQGRIMSEMATRFIAPFMNVLLVLIAMVMLLKSSLLRRGGFNMSAPLATISMGGAMAFYMVMTNYITSMLGFWVLGGTVIGAIIVLFLILKGKVKKGKSE
ncbi:MAG: LptF/LptG family permease [Alphaproteobacteria bacterium]|nr:LptF/LptG family permease [Alphaproteobacteria bacterium]